MLPLLVTVLLGLGIFGVFRMYQDDDFPWGYISLVASIAGFAILGTLSIHTGSSSGGGVSVGIVTSVGQEGTFWQPTAIYLVHQGEMQAETFGVTQDDQLLIRRLRDDADHGVRVKVWYRSSVVCWAWNQPNCDVIVCVQEMPKGRSSEITTP